MRAFLRNVFDTLLPAPLRTPLLDRYHFFLAWLGAVLYGFPSRSMLTIAVTGTKGKTSVTEMLNSILEEAGHKTALINSIRFKIAGRSERNTLGRSTPGRFFIQRFLHDALEYGCTAAIIEMTSEGARQHRHRFLDLDALVFLNLAPEHIESHGSYDAYANAKFEIGRQLLRSRKRPRIIVGNADDTESTRYLTLGVEAQLPFALSGGAPYQAGEAGGYFTFDGVRVPVHFPGEFSLKNALAAATLARALNIRPETIARGLERLTVIPGRAERIEAGQDFAVIVDYAHTPDSLKALFNAYKGPKICLLGSAGGGRDTWKRPVFGLLADSACEHVIVTNDDPYDEDPAAIIRDITSSMQKKPEVVPNRREAIRRALSLAKQSDTVLIIGKGTDPIAGPGGKRIPWNDVEVAREELAALLKRGKV